MTLDVDMNIRAPAVLTSHQKCTLYRHECIYMFRTFYIDGVPLLWMTASRELLATLELCNFSRVKNLAARLSGTYGIRFTSEMQ